MERRDGSKGTLVEGEQPARPESLSEHDQCGIREPDGQVAIAPDHRQVLAAVVFAHGMAELGDDGLAVLGEHEVDGERQSAIVGAGWGVGRQKVSRVEACHERGVVPYIGHAEDDGVPER